MKLNNLSLRDKEVFSEYLNLTNHELSVYAFENIYIWKGLFEISWAEIENSLCIFFKDKIGAFLYLAPLAKELKPEAVGETFKILGRINTNQEISRIENVEGKNLDFYRKLGYVCRQKSSDYICLRSDLTRLRGNVFKSKRASFNYFIIHYKHSFTNFTPKDKNACLTLYDLWAAERRSVNKDDLYRFMLEDSRKSLKVLLENYQDLNCTGRLVKVDNQLKGFTFGFKLNKNTLCILYEITDLTVKGLAQFIFREFCREMQDYKYINIMDDSGLENLKQVKLSYHPIKFVPAYIVKRKL